ncbi:cell wall-binding repeat-containing protein [Leifsonia sp. 22587]|uniref:cell wall-binding repeat-containing protein n=1 Tax=Leifsonia sp. 22587 TaxID=3453946 RepID=UPI003F845420
MNRALTFAVAAAAALAVIAPAPAFAATAGSERRATVAAVTAPAPATADPGSASPSDATPPALPQLHRRSAGAFAGAAAKLAPEVAKAVQRDLDISPAEYLARAAAAQDGDALVDALRARTGARVAATLDGTALTVYASDARTADLARQAGATAVVGSAPQHPVAPLTLHPLAGEVYGGEPYLIPATAGSYRCSAGFPGFGLATGAPQLLSAGHCAMAGSSATYELSMPGGPYVTTGSDGTAVGPLGAWIPGAVQFGNNGDSSLMSLTAGHSSQPSALTWGGGAGAPTATAPMTVTSVAAAVVGAPLCKSGSTTGWTCGTVLDTDTTVYVQDEQGTHTVNSIIASTCADHGDSGGAALIGNAAVGVVSAGPDVACSDPDYYTAFYPMASSTGGSSVTSRYASTWEPAVSVSATVAVTSLPATNRVSQGGVISGTISGATPGTTVRLQLANEATARVATVVNGAWSVSLVGAPTGGTTYTARAAYGTYSLGAAVSGPLSIVPIPTQRVAGPDRFTTSVQIAQQAYPTTADVVYVATGLNYPDALSAGPAAAKQGGPLLLVGYTLSDAVRSEILSLQPKRIVIVGGVNAVPPAVEDSLQQVGQQLGATVSRVAGVDRFDTSQQLATLAFGDSIPSAYVATGTNFPDALAAGAAAGAHGAPVLLVNGGAGGIDAGTTAFLNAKGTTAVTVVGGPTVVTPGVASGLAANGRTVTRYYGGDRFETAEAVGRGAFPTFTTAYLASGFGFPDALAGSALAASRGAPLFTTNGSCVPRSVLGDLAAQNTGMVYLLGGTSVLSPGLQSLPAC